MLEGTADGRVGEADGDGAEGAGIQFGMPLHDVEGALRRERVVVAVDTVDDFALFGLGVWGDGKTGACGGMSGFWGRCTRGSGDDGLGLGVGEVSRSGGWIHECNGGGAELCLGRDDFDGAVEDVDGGRRGGHVAVVWRCCCK